MLAFIPMLCDQRDLLAIPRGRARFDRYLRLMGGPDFEVIRPLHEFNPMAGPVLADRIDALLDHAAEAADEAVRRLGEKGPDMRAALVVLDDLAGSWTARERIELDRIRRPARSKSMRDWLVVPWWASEAATADAIRAAVLASAYRAIIGARSGPRRTLGGAMELEGRALGFAGAIRLALDPDDLQYSKAVLEPLRESDDLPVILAAMYGDGPARRLGHPPLGLSARAGCAVALAETQAAWRRWSRTGQRPRLSLQTHRRAAQALPETAFRSARRSS